MNTQKAQFVSFTSALCYTTIEARARAIVCLWLVCAIVCRCEERERIMANNSTHAMFVLSSFALFLACGLVVDNER